MRSHTINSPDDAVVEQPNNLRNDAYASSFLLPHQQLGAISFSTNPTDGHVVQVVINGNTVTITFRSSIGILPGNVLIGATLAESLANFMRLILHPTITTATGVQISGALIPYLYYVQYSLIGTAITFSSQNNSTYAPLTSFSVSSTVVGSSYTANTMKIFVEPGNYMMGNVRVVFTGGSSPLITAPSTNPRIDLLCIDATGTLSLVTGSESGTPVAPTYPNDKITLCEIYNVVGETGIFDNENQQTGQGYILYDVRIFLNGRIYAAVNDDLFPDTDNARKLGSLAKRWSELHAVALFGDGSGLTNVAIAGTGTLLTVNPGFRPVTQADGVSSTFGQIQKGIVPTSGDVQNVTTNPINEGALCNMDAATIVEVYRETTGPSWKVRAGTVLNGVITYGAAVTLSSTTDSPAYIVSLDATHFVVAYGISTSTLRFVAGTLSGTAITMGSDTTQAATTQAVGALIAMDSTHFVFAAAASAQAYSIAGSVSGTTITLGSLTNMGTSGSFTVSSFPNDGFSADNLDSTYFVVLGTNNAVIVGSISGTTITFGSANTSVIAAGSRRSTTKLLVLDSTHFIQYEDRYDLDQESWVRCFSTSGTSISAGTPVSLIATGYLTGGFNDYSTCISKIDSSHFFVIAQGYYAFGCAVSGTTITHGTYVVVAGGYGSYLVSSVLIDTNLTEFIFSDGTQITGGRVTSSGTTLSGFLSNTFTSAGSITSILGFVALGDSLQSVILDSGNSHGENYVSWLPKMMIGVANSTGSGGASITVFSLGFLAIFTGLTEGLLYYINNDGGLGVGSGDHRLGYAINSTTINVTAQW